MKNLQRITLYKLNKKIQLRTSITEYKLNAMNHRWSLAFTSIHLLDGTSSSFTHFLLYSTMYIKIISRIRYETPDESFTHKIYEKFNSLDHLLNKSWVTGFYALISSGLLVPPFLLWASTQLSSHELDKNLLMRIVHKKWYEKYQFPYYSLSKTEYSSAVGLG